ncbi:hypothetical protein ACFOEI_19385, partial [Modicisalibacter luteus]
LDNGPEFIGYDLFSHTENLGMADAVFKVLKGTVKPRIISSQTTRTLKEKLTGNIDAKVA